MDWRTVWLWVFVVAAWVAVAVVVGGLKGFDGGTVTGVYGIRGEPTDAGMHRR